MKKIAIFAALASALMLAGCGERSAKEVVEANGYTDVHLAGIPLFACGHGDSVFYNVAFTAKAQNGKYVRGAVCGGMFKGWTLRITGFAN